MDIDSLTLGEAKQLAKLFCGGSAPLQTQTHPYVGKYVIVRTYSAGVHFGTLQSANGQEVILTDARRLYSWSGAFTLSAVSREGITGGQVSVHVPTIALTQAIEIIPTSAEAETCLRTFKTHKP
jgi:hypothetical protein